VYNHLPTGRGDDYRNLSGEPLFPFGFGLSYTTFEYTIPAMEKNSFHLGDTLKVDLKLTNTGSRQGTEIVQCYLKSLVTDEIRPVQELIHFQRVPLIANETSRLELHFVLNQDLSTFGLTPGDYEVQIGHSSKDIREVIPFKIR
jgi:beta-glucosidase